MTQLEALLAAQSLAAGQARRTARFRHRRLVEAPIVLVLYQLGAEPFAVAAIGYGQGYADRHLVVGGEPRNRDLAFGALLQFARWFNPRFEAAPCQVVVANAATVELLDRIGRRLAYLPTDGPHPADPQLVRLGQHLRFLVQHFRFPGQQLVVALTDFLGAHWATPQSAIERQSLAALDAWIAPPPGVHGYDAAASAELLGIGPAPNGDDDEALAPLVDAFNAARGRQTSAAIVTPLLQPIRQHYRPLVRRTWELIWRCLKRESAYPEALSVAHRWAEDVDAHTRHIAWVTTGGRQRTRQTPRQAAMTLRILEARQRRVLAEEAIDDPIRMIPFLLDHKAVLGTVVSVRNDHFEPGRARQVRRPQVTLVSVDPCFIPPGRVLYWTAQPEHPAWIVARVDPTPAGGARVTLTCQTSRPTTLPAVGDAVCYSIHTTAEPWTQRLPAATPWTHVPDVPLPEPGPIEASAESPSANPGDQHV